MTKFQSAVFPCMPLACPVKQTQPTRWLQGGVLHQPGGPRIQTVAYTVSTLSAHSLHSTRTTGDTGVYCTRMISSLADTLLTSLPGLQARCKSRHYRDQVQMFVCGIPVYCKTEDRENVEHEALMQIVGNAVLMEALPTWEGFESPGGGCLQTESFSDCGFPVPSHFTPSNGRCLSTWGRQLVPIFPTYFVVCSIHIFIFLWQCPNCG